MVALVHRRGLGLGSGRRSSSPTERRRGAAIEELPDTGAVSSRNPPTTHPATDVLSSKTRGQRSGLDAIRSVPPSTSSITTI